MMPSRIKPGMKVVLTLRGSGNQYDATVVSRTGTNWGQKPQTTILVPALADEEDATGRVHLTDYEVSRCLQPRRA